LLWSSGWRSSCLCLLSAGIIGVNHHTHFYVFLTWLHTTSKPFLTFWHSRCFKLILYFSPALVLATSLNTHFLFIQNSGTLNRTHLTLKSVLELFLYFESLSDTNTWR
jgi:hypothetical protein